jgi:hypothetical protein
LEERLNTIKHLASVAFYKLYDEFITHYPEVVKENPDEFKASCDSKVRQFKSHKNSIGFLAGYSCPMATLLCLSVCYTQRGFSGLPASEKFKAHNTWVLFKYLKEGDVGAIIERLKRVVEFADRQYARRLAKLEKMEHRSEDDQKEYRQMVRSGSIFRWQWSGDVVDANHARAIVEVSKLFPEVQFWLYTRTFDILGTLEDKSDNLMVWLSVDADNKENAEVAHASHPWTQKAVMQTRAEVTNEVICPEQNGKIEIEKACARCMICPSVTFKEKSLAFITDQDKKLPNRRKMRGGIMTHFNDREGLLQIN